MIDEYDYYLPQELIAQTPLKNRSDSKLLVMDKKTGKLKEGIFKNIIDYLKPEDILVLNDTKVIPARLIGEKNDTHAVIELLLLKNIENDLWECLSKPQKRLHVGTIISFGDGTLKAEVLEKKEEGIVIVKLLYKGILMEILDKLGTMPLPPYIHKTLEDQSRYQTVYAKHIGSAAAPTAGLHFTNELLEKIKEKGITLVYVTLHVGLGTFRPVEVSDITKHHMHSEYYILTKEAADILNNAKGKIYAVGTTSTRVLETVRKNNEKFVPCSGNTDIFIYPGFKFKAIDGLITNFHLPKSTLLMLVSALSSKEKILNAYDYAIKHNFRFFSFGDAMFIK
ncbi:MAG: tRNA preQ1(34) S-adenosylmethionine ribosyltransferase-isomerase QueA [Bacilli bacterium]